MDLDYNQAYYHLSQARVNQLSEDQERYLFVEFDYSNDQEILRNIYRDKKDFILKIEFTSDTNGNILLVNKKFYREELYEYVTVILDSEFYQFYLENLNNPIYRDIDLRLVWYFVALDRNTELYIKKVRDTKYIFSFKKLCAAYEYPVKERADIRVCCKNVGLLKDIVTNQYYCPVHFASKNGNINAFKKNI